MDWGKPLGTVWGTVMVLGMFWENLPLVEVPQAPGLVVWIQEPSRGSAFPGKLPPVEVPQAPGPVVWIGDWNQEPSRRSVSPGVDFPWFLLYFLVLWIGDWVQEPSWSLALPGSPLPP